MEAILVYVLFFAGIALVVKGGDVFVDAASWIARAMNIPTFIIGATIVSVATTMPEMLVSAIAAGQGKTDMAIGNAVGSVTANIGLILAVAMIAMHIAFPRKRFLPQSVLMIVTAAVLYVGSLAGALSPWASTVLAVIFVGFMAYNVFTAKKDMKGGDEQREKPEKKEYIKNIVLFVVGAAAIVLGSQLMVNNGSEIAARLGVPDRIIAVTLIAVGTSLPELVTTITSIVKKESGLSVGNIIGANIIDMSLVLPICSLVSGRPIPVSASALQMDLPVCLGISCLALVPMMIRQKGSRLLGVLVLASYLAYVIVVI